jgi:carbon storage regulator CsrA
MTVITRCENEGIVIGRDLVVTVLEIQADQIRLGFTCPARTPSYWEETLCLAMDDDEFDDVPRYYEPQEVFLEA